MSISGDWYNEFGSHMRITADPTGCLRGTYVSATGHAVGAYPLVGRCDTVALADHGTPLGWSVAWRNGRTDAGSVTSWNGQYYEDGGERIYVTWLLTVSASANDTWGRRQSGRMSSPEYRLPRSGSTGARGTPGPRPGGALSKVCLCETRASDDHRRQAAGGMPRSPSRWTRGRDRATDEAASPPGPRLRARAPRRSPRRRPGSSH